MGPVQTLLLYNAYEQHRLVQLSRAQSGERDIINDGSLPSSSGLASWKGAYAPSRYYVDVRSRR